MSQSEDPVDILIERLNQLHQAQVEMKDRQVTAEDTKRMEQTLKASVNISKELEIEFRRMATSVNTDISLAMHNLSYAKQQVQREASQLQEEHYRKIRRFGLFSAIVGVVLGVVLGIVVLDYHNARIFQDSVQGMFGEQVCRQAGGNTATVQETGKRVCAFNMR